MSAYANVMSEIGARAVVTANRTRNVLLPKARAMAEKCAGGDADEFDIAIAAVLSLNEDLERARRLIAIASAPWFEVRQ